MKGLLLKDFYMMKKYCKSYLLIAAVFIAVTFFGNDNFFFVFYPCILCGMIPVNLIAYDEQSRFNIYSGTLPYTKAQIVSGKYLIGFLVQTAMFIIMGVVQAIKMNMNGSFRFANFAVLMLTMFCASVATVAISLPFMFKFGVEKGRMVHLFTIGIICAACFVLPTLIGNIDMSGEIAFNGFLLGFCAICVCLYALSWYLSIIFYKKREV